MMKLQLQIFIASITLLMIAGCNQEPDSVATEGTKVDASGEEAKGLDAVPAAVRQAAHAVRPDLEIVEGEYETRGGNEYFEVGGTLPDGSELELDMTLQDGVWTVAAVQRDIGIELAPAVVRDALRAHAADWTPNRIIESDQGGGIIVYEFFGPGETDELLRINVKFENGAAEVLY